MIRFTPCARAAVALLLLAGNAASFAGSSDDKEPEAMSAAITSPAGETAAEATDSSLVRNRFCMPENIHPSTCSG